MTGVITTISIADDAFSADDGDVSAAMTRCHVPATHDDRASRAHYHFLQLPGVMNFQDASIFATDARRRKKEASLPRARALMS